MGAQDKVREIMTILRKAAHGLKRMHADSQADFDLQSYINLLHRLIFQTPSTKASQAAASGQGAGQGASYFRFAAEAGMKPMPVTSKEFYAPHFVSIPRERCAFFRNSIRLSAVDLRP